MHHLVSLTELGSQQRLERAEQVPFCSLNRCCRCSAHFDHLVACENRPAAEHLLRVDAVEAAVAIATVMMAGLQRPAVVSRIAQQERSRWQWRV